MDYFLHHVKACFWLGYFLIIVPSLAHASSDDNGAAYHARIKQIEEQVNAIEQSIVEQQAKRSQYSQSLRVSELKIADIAKKMHQASEASLRAQQELGQLNARLKMLNSQLAKHRETLHELLKKAYQAGRHSPIQLLLNQQSPEHVDRLIKYYDYFNLAQQRKVDEVLTLLKQLKIASAEKIEKSKQLKKAHRALQNAHQETAAAREDRKVALKNIERSLAQKSTTLKELQADQRDLQTLLDRLNAVFEDIPAPPIEQKPFNTMKGKLPWPTQGRLKGRYNTLKGIANLRWKGLFVEADMGEEVQSIYFGQVVFANWMNGFGLVMIIDHGSHYMSIYTNNRELHKSQGDWVVQGETIANVGDSGGQPSSGLYFEIRHNGYPVDPQKWIKRL